MIRSKLTVAVAAFVVATCTAQQSGWLPNQVNTTMCTWNLPRAAVIRDTVYIDGGDLWWQPGLADGDLGGVISDSNPLGLVYLLNFSIPFNTSDNVSSLLTTISKAPNGGNANNIGPNYLDGAMLANDYQWFTYGGQLDDTAAWEELEEDSVAKYMRYQSGPVRQFESGWQLDRLPENITRYVTNGAAVSVPSENLGYYFAGHREKSWGPISTIPGNASQLSLTLIEVDMTTQLEEKWANYTLPSTVPGRANAEIVWVPVSERGMLVAIGGVIHPYYASLYSKTNASAVAQSESISPGFMETVSVYDISSKTWYEQETSGKGPGQLAEGCTVVASAQDGSSHNIYWYGGFDGLNPESPNAFNDDVYVLSVPSFVWMKVKSGTISHGRAGHRCVKPYPDQMFVIGGYTALVGSSYKCVEDGLIQIFNLSSAEWMTSYDPRLWSEYSLPSTIYETIGGSPVGGASMLKPSGSGFSNNKLASLFGTKYDTSKIKKWYPYKLTQEEKNNGTAQIPTREHKSGTPSYLAPVLGVVLGLFFITLIILAIMLYRRRKFLRRNGTASQSEAGTLDNRRWVTTWLRSTPADPKAPPTTTTEETPTTSYDEEHEIYVRPVVPEMGDGQVHEMADTSRPVELHDTGFVPVLKLGKDRDGLAASPSVTSTRSHVSRSSTVSRVSDTSARPGVSPVGSPHSVSDEDFRRRIASDISGISEGERGHLRGISETSVSTVGDYMTPGLGIGSNGTPPVEADSNVRQGVVSPLSPPEGVSSDYIGASAGTPISRRGGSRRSNFSEGLDKV